LSNPEIQNLLQTGIEAARSGNRAAARMILGQVVERDPRNELGWMWLASVADTAAERRTYLQKVLDINPANDRAKQALERLEQAAAAAPPPSRPSEPRAAPPIIQTPILPSVEKITTDLDLPREALMDLPTQRRRFPAIFMVGIVLALALIGTGFYMLWSYTQQEQEAATATPIPPTSVIDNPTAAPRLPTPTPRGGAFVTLPPMTPPPTWTAAPIVLPTATLEPTATPAPPAALLMVSVRPPGSDNWELALISGEDMETPRMRLEDENFTLLETYDAVFSPNGRQVVFTAHLSNASGGTAEEIGIARAQGGPITLLTNLGAAHTQSASWSPDGTQIAFESNADGDYDIYLVSVEGGQPQNLTAANGGMDQYPAWSPDGQMLAYASDRESPGFLDIWLMGVDGSNPERLTRDANSYDPAWSPDGRLIAFISNRNQDNDLFVMKADGTNEHPLTVNDGIAEDRDPVWTSDGMFIAFSSNRDSDEFNIYMIRSDGFGLQPFTSDLGDTRYPSWEPHE
jgi:hypothetical protein